jgi:hypothetical protein
LEIKKALKMINSEAYLTYILQKIANIKENILREK